MGQYCCGDAEEDKTFWWALDLGNRRSPLFFFFQLLPLEAVSLAPLYLFILSSSGCDCVAVSSLVGLSASTSNPVAFRIF